MDYWAQTGKQAILAALQAACDSVQADLATQIQQQISDKHASLLEEIDRLKAVAAKVDRLEKENHALVEELARLRRHELSSAAKEPESSSTAHISPQPEPAPLLGEASPNNGPPSTTTAPSASDPDEDEDWKEKYTKWRRRYTELQDRYEKLREQTKAYREARDGWQLYAESLQVKVEKLERKMVRHGTPGRSSADPAASEAGAEATDAGRIPSEATTDGSDGADELPTRPPGEDPPHERPVYIKQEPSSDIPVVVSERAVRKRKNRDEGTGGATPPRRIKCEPSSSPFAILGEARVFSPHESIDLDGEDNGIPTPRKQRPRERELLEDEDEATATSETVAPDLADAGRPRPWDTPLGRMGESSNTLEWPSSRSKGPSRAAGKINPSIKPEWTLKSGIADVAEETPESFYAPAPRRTEKEALQTPAQSRLHSLLNQKSLTETSSPSKLPRNPSSLLKRRPLTETNTPSRLPSNPNFDLDKENPGSWSERQLKRPNDALARPAPAAFTSPAAPLRGQTRGNSSKTVRLRDKPLDQLRPEDFKVNPKANNGHRFAFDEVVRNRDERAGLSGCTDPKCCGGEWRLMAESELSAGGMAILERPGDVEMMEEYLGPEAYQLAAMTPEERRETWLKAKIQDLADRYGRHRHRFQRRPSPPGYWNPDFPSTQEIERNKKEAEEVERRIVEDRWREAIRGGRWLFRDE
ncbi:hypothetical protein VTJ49DRAFT_5939 [Mycothermus thermophilus]|uniref:DNA endonuclease activator Ctp1 C-terminal domain-containing protein n=1 Tax=Humicola insolens TaxID=85995 RepID=A0ABR3VK85_HUMIN